MDLSSITAVLASLKGAQELASAALGVKGFNDSAATISEINQKLLAAQQGLLAHNTMLLQLQQDYFQTTEELRKIKEAVAKKDSYPLVDIGNGALAYAVHVNNGGQGDPEIPQPQHCLCQVCWDREGIRSVLQPAPRAFGNIYRVCNHCGKELFVGASGSRDSAPAPTGSVYNPLG